MKQKVLLQFVLISSLGALLAPSTAKADPVYKSTTVTFSGPVEIPGTVLFPGTYVIKLLDPYGDSNLVRFYNPDESHMYAMVRAIPDYRVNATEHAVITLEERANGAPQAIKEWFAAGENWGEEFVYPKAKTVAAAQAAPPPAQPRRAEVAPAPAPSPAPAPAPLAQAQPQSVPVQIAQAQPAPAPARPTTPAPEKELPKTASDLPILGLSGALLVLAGGILRRRTA